MDEYFSFVFFRSETTWPRGVVELTIKLSVTVIVLIERIAIYVTRMENDCIWHTHTHIDTHIHARCRVAISGVTSSNYLPTWSRDRRPEVSSNGTMQWSEVTCPEWTHFAVSWRHKSIIRRDWWREEKRRITIHRTHPSIPITWLTKMTNENDSGCRLGNEYDACLRYRSREKERGDRDNKTKSTFVESTIIVCWSKYNIQHNVNCRIAHSSRMCNVTIATGYTVDQLRL